MKRKSFFAGLLVLVLLLTLTGCASVPILKGSDFSKEYKAFLKSMQKHPPVSVEYEQYLKGEGFDADKLITDSDTVTLRELANALAQVKILGQVEEASNFAVKHYTFTNEKGKQFTFEFYGSYLKAEGKFYETENSRAFISIRVEEKKSGSFLAALDELYEGKGEYTGQTFLSCRLLEEEDGALEVVELVDYVLSPQADITAPTSHGDFAHSQKVSFEAFFETYEEVKGQENEAYIFRLTIDKGVITAMVFEREASANANLSLAIN